jgi:hypothetical protein
LESENMKGEPKIGSPSSLHAASFTIGKRSNRDRSWPALGSKGSET